MALLVRAFALIIAGWLAVSACAWAGAPAGGARGTVLLLKNGRIMRGYITPLGDHYLVALDERNEVRVPAAQVEMHCPTLQDAYARRRDDLPAGRIEPRLDLAEWCIREELLAEAAEQLTTAAMIEPANPRLELMRLRLQLAHQPRSVAAITPRPVAAPADEVSASVQALPAEAVAQFATTIQPILMNRCGAAACHGPTSDSSFLLLRPSWAKSLPQRLTYRNLHATVQLIDRDQPELSPLVRICREPHGKSTTAIFEDADHYQWGQLKAWIRMLARQGVQPPPLAFAPPETILSRTMPDQANRLPQTRDDSPGAAEIFQESDAPVTASQRTASTLFRPRDPFDAEIFNRRFFPPPSEPTAR
jgi:hypothetical protein